MRQEVVVKFDGGQERRAVVSSAAAMSHEQARQWLDEQFRALECEPLRASGKVLVADKLLAIAHAAGLSKFEEAAWFDRYAAAAAGALGKPLVTVDLPAVSVGY